MQCIVYTVFINKMKNSYLKEIIGCMLNYPIYFEPGLNKFSSMPQYTYKNNNRTRVAIVSSRIEIKVPFIVASFIIYINYASGMIVSFTELI